MKLKVVYLLLKTLFFNVLGFLWIVVPFKPKVRSMFLSGNFAPVRDELDSSNLETTGKIPSDLKGMFVRVGPNPKFHPIAEYHWFDGDGMMHGVRFTSGGPSYVNRFVETKMYLENKKAGKEQFYGLAQLNNLVFIIWEMFVKGRTALGKLRTQAKKAGRANTAMEYHAGRLMALYEASLPYQIKAPTLETVGQYDFHGRLHHPFTAHPKKDPVTNELMIFGYKMDEEPFLLYSTADGEGNLKNTVSIHIDQPVMMHDFAITEHYSIFPVYPFIFDKKRLALGDPVFTFHPEIPTKIGILPRHAASSNEMRWFNSAPCFSFHTVNAYEEGDEVVFYSMRSERTTSFLGTVKNEEAAYHRPHLYQWRFNMKTGDVKEKQLDERECEFPRINPAYLGRKFRYVYCAQTATGSGGEPRAVGIVKYDLQQETSESYLFPIGSYGGESVFVARVHAQAEDDGYLMTYVCNENTMTSDLVIWDAQSVARGPICRVHMPRRIPYGFHGLWITNEQIASQRFD